MDPWTNAFDQWRQWQQCVLHNFQTHWSNVDFTVLELSNAQVLFCFCLAFSLLSKLALSQIRLVPWRIWCRLDKICPWPTTSPRSEIHLPLSGNFRNKRICILTLRLWPLQAKWEKTKHPKSEVVWNKCLVTFGKQEGKCSHGSCNVRTRNLWRLWHTSLQSRVAAYAKYFSSSPGVK